MMLYQLMQKWPLNVPKQGISVVLYALEQLFSAENVEVVYLEISVIRTEARNWWRPAQNRRSMIAKGT
jgi:hypothetical protein